MLLAFVCVPGEDDSTCLSSHCLPGALHVWMEPCEGFSPATVGSQLVLPLCGSCPGDHVCSSLSYVEDVILEHCPVCLAPALEVLGLQMLITTSGLSHGFWDLTQVITLVQ